MIISEDQEANEQTLFHPSDAYRQNAHISSIEEYRKMYKKSIEQPEEFWRAFFDEFHFKSGPTGPCLTYNFDIRKGPIEIRWFEGAITNICFNLLDRNVARGFGDRIAYIWEGNEPDQTTSITYHELLLQVCKFSNVLLQKGIKKGDRVAIYLPVTIELVISMLACARIGAIHSVIFAGFSGDSIADRILDCNCKLLITCDGVFRGTKFISLKAMADDAIRICKQKNHTLNACIVYHHLKNNRKVSARLAYTNEEVLPVARVQEAKENVAQLSEPCDRSDSPEIHSAQSSPISDANDSGVESDEVKRSSRSHSPSSSVASSSDSNALTSPCRSPANSTSSSIQTSDDSTDIEDTLGKQAPPPSFAFAKQAASCEHEAESDSIEITIPWDQTLDFWWHDLMALASEECEPCWVDAEHPLFILYTSGSTGKPKGVVHSTAGYMIYAATAFKYVFNYIGGDVFFCTADLGWITGHTVNCYGSLANAATIVLFDGTPFYPTPARLCEMIERHKVNTFYTAPTAIRSLMGYGDKWVKGSDVSSLKLLGTAGEPINKEAWLWYYQQIGNSRCPIVDTFWQTETGAPVLTPLPGCTPLKPGSATLPFFGVQPALLDEEGHELIGPATGHLVFKSPWPAMMRTVDGNHHRFQSTYFTKFPGYYCAGDGVKRDKDGYYWITGRTDDLLNVSGHLMSTSQIEGAIAVDERVAEAAVVSATHQIKGQCVYCFLVLKADVKASSELDKEIKAHIRHSIGAIAVPDVVQICRVLPKTRSGKIMRRLLKQIAGFDFNFGDISTLQDESVLDELIEMRKSHPKLN